MTQQAIGMIETKGLCALLEATDSALKAANVQFVGWEKIGSGYVTAFFAAMSRRSRLPRRRCRGCSTGGQRGSASRLFHALTKAWAAWASGLQQ